MTMTVDISDIQQLNGGALKKKGVNRFVTSFDRASHTLSNTGSGAPLSLSPNVRATDWVGDWFLYMRRRCGLSVGLREETSGFIHRGLVQGRQMSALSRSVHANFFDISFVPCSFFLAFFLRVHSGLEISVQPREIV